MAPLAVALKNLRPSTVSNHTKHLQAFAKFREFGNDINATLDDFFSDGRERARELFWDFHKKQTELGRKRMVISNRMTAIVIATRQNERTGRIDWNLDSEWPIAKVAKTTPQFKPGGPVAIALKGLSDTTQDRYLHHYKAYASYRGAPSLDAAFDEMFNGTRDQAHRLFLGFLKKHDRKAASTGLIITAFNRAVDENRRKTRRFDWTLDIDRPMYDRTAKTVPLTEPEWRRLLAKAEAEAKLKPSRTMVPCLLLLLRSFPPGQVVGLDLVDVDVCNGTIRIGDQRFPVTPAQCSALARWLGIREHWEGHLFPNGKSIRGSTRLTAKGLGLIVKRLGERAGLKQVVTTTALRKPRENGNASARATTSKSTQKYYTDKTVQIIYESYKFPAIFSGIPTKLGKSLHAAALIMIKYKDDYMDSTAFKQRLKEAGVSVQKLKPLINRLRKKGEHVSGEIESPGPHKEGAYRIPRGVIRPNPTP